MRQYQTINDKSLKDYINDGYELKGVTAQSDAGDTRYFLQKGTDVVMCDEISSLVGGKVVLRSLSCAELIKPVPY